MAKHIIFSHRLFFVISLLICRKRNHLEPTDKPKSTGCN